MQLRLFILSSIIREKFFFQPNHILGSQIDQEKKKLDILWPKSDKFRGKQFLCKKLFFFFVFVFVSYSNSSIDISYIVDSSEPTYY